MRLRKHRVPESEAALEKYSSGTRWRQLGQHFFHDMKHNPIGSMMVIDVLGLFFSLGLVGKTFLQKTFREITSTIDNGLMHKVSTQVSVSAPSNPEHPKIGEVNAQEYS